MLSRRTGDAIEFSADGRAVLFTLDARRFADISCLCADGDELVATAAEGTQDVADVRANRRGNYRAWRLGARGERCLTREYTHTAIALPGSGGEAIAYSNGSNLVLLEGGQRRAFKTGTFNWGPVSLSVDAAGQRVAMTKWRGDDRKLFWVERIPGTSGVSAFSYFSYLLTNDACCFCTASAVKRYNFAEAALVTISDARFVARLLPALGLDAAERGGLDCGWRGLARLGDRLVAAVTVRRKADWRQLAQAVLAFDAAGAALEVLDSDLGAWGVTGLSSDGRTVCARLERHENLRLVESTTRAYGEQAAALAAGWHLVSDARQPDPGFPFLPG